MKNYTKIILLGLFYVMALNTNAQSIFPILPGSVLADGDDNQVLRDWLDDYGQAPKGTLLYRRSTHGGSSYTFHSRVDEKGPTLVIFKASNGQVFGGYTPNSWSSSSRGYKNSSDAFLFNLNSNRKASPYYPQHSIYTENYYGPTFGAGFDIHIRNDMNSGYFNVYSYNSIDGSSYRSSTSLNALTGINTSSTSFGFGAGFITEIEVYQIEYNASNPIIQGQDITIALNANGNATITTQDIDTGTSDPDGLVSVSIDKTDFNCDDLGGNSNATATTFIGSQPQITHSYGGGYNPNTNEFWYPQWSGNTIYVYDDQNQFIRSFNNNHGNIMQIWADTDDPNAYYTTNFYGPTISKNLITGGVAWTTNTGLQYASGVTTDSQYAYVFGYNSNLIKVYDKNNGQFVKQYIMPGTIYGYSTIVAANEFLYIGGNANGWSDIPYSWDVLHKFNKDDGTYIESISTNGVSTFSSAFDGETIWISNNSNVRYGYKVSEGNAYGGSSGSNAVVLTAIDTYGNTSSETFSITVEDNIAPTITLNGDATVNVTIGELFTDPEATVEDNCSAELEITGTLDLNTLGEYTLTYKAIDGSGNESEPVTRTVNVVPDNLPPVAVCKEVSVSADANCEGTAVASDFNDGSSDPDGDELTFSISPAGPYAIGETEVTLTVTDPSGLTSICVTKITVTDDELPVITASSGITQTADAGECGAIVTIVDATATDNCSVGAVTGTRSDGLALTASYPVGETTITWTVTDINGNDAEAVTQKVTVSDDELPVITASSAITQTADSGLCGAIVTIVDATATDNCSVGAVTGTRSDGEALTALYPVGETTITWTVTDINNNDAEAVTQKVTVSDDEDPIISGLPSDIFVNNDPLNCSAIVNWSVPTASDNCEILSFVSSHNSGDTFPEGITTVTYTATDIHNNVYSASFDIKVTNTLPNNTQGIIGGIYPIQAGADFYLSADFNDDNLDSVTWYFSSDGDFTNGDTAEYSFTYSGGVSGGTVSRMFNFDASQTGVYTVKVVVTDFCGESAEVKFNYVVIYDPSGGFVTGGGWIYSPVGALVGSNTKGKANFGFVAKYKTGKNNVLTLDGNTNFQFKEGDFHFKSNEYDEMSLVISGGKKATYRGTGTVNRNGSHKFLVTVIDGDATGGDGDDKFRIKIWADGSSSDVIYDNEFNAPENADSNTIIGGGSIVIHKPKGKNNKIDTTLDNPEIVEGLELKSWPNPSDSYFNLKVKSNNNIDNVEILVFDVTNKLVFKNNFNPNFEYKFGENLEGGIYVIKIIQADIQKSIRLVKY
jgi:hypothetical protein